MPIWEDPDLNSPVSPITLKVIPGAKKQYQHAFKIYSNREFAKAIELFEAFIKRFPDDLDADNSQFWIGKAYFQIGDDYKAEQAFRRVIRNYRHNETRQGFKTPDAILMLGRIYSKRDKPIKARYYYQQVIERFPGSISADKAQKEIQSMNSF